MVVVDLSLRDGHGIELIEQVKQTGRGYANGGAVGV